MPFELFLLAVPKRITYAIKSILFSFVCMQCMRHVCMWCAIESGLQTLSHRSLMFYCNSFAVHSPFFCKNHRRFFFSLVYVSSIENRKSQKFSVCLQMQQNTSNNQFTVCFTFLQCEEMCMRMCVCVSMCE